MKTRIVCFFVLLVASLAVHAQEVVGRLYCTDADRAVYARCQQVLEEKRSLPLGELMVETARLFLGTPYVASILEREPEGLVANLRELDCTTFAENVLAIARTMKSPDTSFDNYCRNLQSVRYRDGKIETYTDRLHYMTDWLYENSRKGLVKDVNCEIGGAPLSLNLSFISTHPDSYKQLSGSPLLISRMVDKENEINARSYFYLPKADICSLAEKIADGDIVCFATTIKGLDVTHVGVACRVDGKLTFIHASSSAKRVIVNEESLATYVGQMKSCKGLLVMRPVDY